MIKYIIVDDNELDRLSLKSFAAQYSVLSFIDDFDNALDGLNAIRTYKPDLVFLDIEMPNFTGLDLQKSIQSQVPISIFVTSHPEFALDGFELSALDYILKPATEERFDQCMQRVFSYWEMKQKSLAYDVFIENDKLTIKQGHDKILLPLNEIIYLEAMNDYTKLHTNTKSYMTLGTLSHFLSQLPKGHFHRTHRSYAVAKNKITGLKKKEVICGTLSIPVSNTYRQELANLL